MNSKMFTVIVLSTEGKVLTVTSTNEKGYKKSIENGNLWHIVPETGRLLPLEMGYGFKFKSIEKKKNWIEAIYTLDEKSKELKEKEKGNVLRNNLGEVFSNIGVLEKLSGIIKDRRKGREGSYTSYLFKEGKEKIRKKLGEEAVELILARKREEIIYESADLFYHLLVLLESEDINLNEIFLELQSRMEEQ